MREISINSVLLLPRKSLTKSGSLFMVHPIYIYRERSLMFTRCDVED